MGVVGEWREEEKGRGEKSRERENENVCFMLFLHPR